MGKVWRLVELRRGILLLTFVAGFCALTSMAGQNAASPEAKAKSAVVIDPPAKEADPMRTDWPNLKRFHGDDVALPAPAAGENRVVFMGDSITEGWKHNGAAPGEADAGFFPGKPYVNRGISGQTTPQMLLRFRQDVIELKPKAVVIFAGTNDIAGNTGDMTPEQTEDNLSSMADLAHANGIKVVLCSILPAFDFPWKPGREPAPKIVAINSWIKDYAASHGYVYVDFYSAMVDARGGLPKNLSKDGVHPVKAGYEIMNPLVEAGIAKALGKG
jgi:lysophospholipase L1-like esterase